MQNTGSAFFMPYGSSIERPSMFSMVSHSFSTMQSMCSCGMSCWRVTWVSA